MSDQPGHRRKFSFLGGRPCLDFANTADWHASDHPEERLVAYSDLVAWSQEAGLLPQNLTKRLLQKASRSAREAAQVLTRAIKLRESVYSIFSAVAAGSKPGADALAVLNGVLAGPWAAGVVPSGKGFTWDWIGREDSLDRLLWPIARSAADLLVSGDLGRVGECADDRGCGWLFLDTSRNHTRRWCDMKDCGNRAKAREHHKRIRGG